jgi:hypothetical protein
MSAAAPKYKVIVQQAIDEAVYFTTGPVSYESVPVPSTVEGEQDTRIVFVRFTPTNGHNKNHEHNVPISRVIAVVAD